MLAERRAKAASELDCKMANNYACSDPWTHTVRLLKTSVDLTDDGDLTDRLRKSTFQATGSPEHTKVLVTGRSTDRSVTVTWCNPTIGYYGAQTWFLTSAHEAGICQMSGDEIHRGDAVYRPRSGSSPPVNVKAMILASRVELPAVEDAPANASKAVRSHINRRRRDEKQLRDTRKKLLGHV